jgi:hypothetical protein
VQSKGAVTEAKDALIRRLQSELQRRDEALANCGAAPATAPAPAPAPASAPAPAPALAPAPAPAHALFHFSSDAAHRAPGVRLSLL